MNKIDMTITNNIKLNFKDKKINMDVVDLFYNLYKNNLVFDPDNFNFVNKDKVIVSPNLEDINNEMIKTFYKDTLAKYEYHNSNDFNVLEVSLGLAIGNRYLENLLKIEDPKNNILNNRVICICKYDELLSSGSFDAINFANSEKLNKMVFLVIKDSYDDCKEDLVDRFSYLKFNIEEVNGISKIGSILEDTKSSKIPTAIFVYLKNNKQVTSIKEEVKLDDIQAFVKKRVNKYLGKWENYKNNHLSDLKIKEIITFLEDKKVVVNFKGSNIKLNDNYEEKIIQSDNKIFNLLVSKNPFIINLSDTIEVQNINKSKNMSKENPLGRNLILAKQINLLGSISLGLAYQGFKVFISTYLANIKELVASLIQSSSHDLDIHYTFLEDNNSINYIDMLNYIPNLITFRPCDINEVIGVYEVIKNYPKTTVNIISNVIVKELKGTNYKYVQAGGYPVKKESDSVNAILIASGFNVLNALTIAQSLVSLGIVLRVVSLPAIKVFDMQNPKYQNMLIPNTKVFILDSGNTAGYKRFIKNNEYILNDYNNEVNKAKIIELMKK